MKGATEGSTYTITGKEVGGRRAGRGSGVGGREGVGDN